MAKVDWLNEVVKTLRDSRVPFPGDPDPALEVLERVVNKLYGECFNDLPVGTDGCPVCRAHQTERAQLAQKVAEDERDAEQAEAAKQAFRAEVAETASFQAALERDQAQSAAKEAVKAAEVARKAELAARQEAQDAVTERGQAQKNATAANTDNVSLTLKLAALQAFQLTAKELAQQIVEG